MTPILVLLAAAQGGAQGGANPITFMAQAAPLERVCQSLAAKTGLSVSPLAELKNEIVAIDVHDVPPADLLRRLAATVCAKVQQTPTGWTLALDQRAQDARREKSLEARTNALHKAQAAMLAQLADEPPFSANKLIGLADAFGKKYDDVPPRQAKGIGAAISEVGRANPGSHALRRLIANLPAETLEAIPDGGTLVFSDQPKRFQAALGEAGRACVEEAANEQNEWASTYHRDGKLDERPTHIALDPRFHTSPMDAHRTRLFLKAQMRSGFSFPSFVGMFVEQEGAVLNFAEVNLDVDPRTAPKPTPTMPPHEPMLSLSANAQADTLAYLARVRPNAGGARGEAREWVLNPEKQEPLGFAISESIVESARSRHENLVACIPDEAFASLFTFIDSKSGQFQSRRPSQVIASLIRQGASVDEAEGWMTVRPEGLPHRLDRAALGRLLRQEDKDGCLRLGPLCEFAAKFEGSLPPSFVDFGADAVLPNAWSTADIRDWFPLHLLGLIPGEQRDALVAGKGVPIATLPVAVQEAVQTTVFFRPAHRLQINAPSLPRVRGFVSLYQEPTEAMPDGFARDATVRLEVHAEDAVDADRTILNGRRSSTMPMSLTELAYYELGKQYPDLVKYGKVQDEDVPTLRPGRQTRYEIAWHLDREITLYQDLWDYDFDLRANPIAIEALSEKYQQQLRADYALIRREEKLPVIPTAAATATPPPR